MPTSIYRSTTGRRTLEECYDTAVERIEVAIDERTVETRYGPTHGLLTGSEDTPPLIVFHGWNATNPMTLAWYTGLTDEYRLIAPDTVGHPWKSAETRLDPGGDGCGKFVGDVMDAFDVESAPMVGTSYDAGDRRPHGRLRPRPDRVCGARRSGGIRFESSPVVM